MCYFGCKTFRLPLRRHRYASSVFRFFATRREAHFAEAKSPRVWKISPKWLWKKDSKQALSLIAHGGPKGTVDTFLKFGNIQGESTNTAHRDEIVLEGFDWNLLRIGTIQAGNLKLTKRVDKASPQLMLLAANKEHTSEVIISIRKPSGRDDFLQLKFNDVVVTSYAVGKDSDTLPTEDIEISLTKVELIYKPLKLDGSFGTPVKSGWDFVQNRSF